MLSVGTDIDEALELLLPDGVGIETLGVGVEIVGVGIPGWVILVVDGAVRLGLEISPTLGNKGTALYALIS